MQNAACSKRKGDTHTHTHSNCLAAFCVDKHCAWKRQTEGGYTPQSGPSVRHWPVKRERDGELDATVGALVFLCAGMHYFSRVFLEAQACRFICFKKEYQKPFSSRVGKSGFARCIIARFAWDCCLLYLPMMPVKKADRRLCVHYIVEVDGDMCWTGYGGRRRVCFRSLTTLHLCTVGASDRVEGVPY